ncbi:hypothetical protein NCAS_0C02760 [Naumovozyma castellii]|uniref:Protein IFH1 n=1 Tax=Naumovozyma castellii TaxID=27288 RepID=G0VCQ6_NAUCA|nr:hypothetical protein NCAS_0C02760 [Naumovozyma castellii CBS 4309]CCC69266.1 hypothetical protein NCAS_0C02760 [Naumovozyma castellii CBS 4309]
MVGNKSPRKQLGGKLPANVEKLKRGQTSMRPRRFSLIYSSDSSSLSDVSEESTTNTQRKKTATKGKKMSNNATGKRSKLIQSKNDDEEGTESSDYEAIVSGNESDSDEEDESDTTSSDSDDDNIDFVKLTAQRKKRAMKALSAIKRNNGKEQTSSAVQSSDSEEEVTTNPKEQPSVAISKSTFNDIELSREDVGEEVASSTSKDYSAPIKSSAILDTVDQLNVPTFSESDESEYDIDHDTYFNVIHNDDEEDLNNNSSGEIDTGLETGEDDLPILHQEEQNIVTELQNDDELSFDGSIHEEGEDPADLEDTRNTFQNFNNEDDEEDEEEDEIMTDFDIPFYEDPKFANLNYYEDGTEPRLSLSTSLPLILNDEKRIKLQKKQAKKLEREERIKRRKQLRKRLREKNQTRSHDLDSDEYIFGVFFQSDNEYDAHSGKDPLARYTSKNHILKHNTQSNLESPLKRLGALSDYDISSDEDDSDILLNEAHIPSADDHSHIHGHSDGASLTSESLQLALDDELDDDDDDDSSVTNVFIDIDDLDPDSFYFHYDDEDFSSSGSNLSDDDKLNNANGTSAEAVEPIVYVDDESTDEDDNLPPPSSRSKNIGSKAKEIVSANVVGLRPPKLGTWETDNKPFSIIDGLSTKSLYALIQEHQQLHEQHQRAQSPDLRKSDTNSVTNGEELTLNELLNMSELEDDDNDPETQPSAWYNDKPTVPLSAFRNKGINTVMDDEYMMPSLSTRKAPIGYVGNERTRRKIDKMKELQRKKTEKKRQLKKKRKLLKIRRERQRLEKEKSLMENALPEEPRKGDEPHIITNPDMHDMPNSNDLSGLHDLQTPESVGGTMTPSLSRKNSVKSVGLDEIHEILGKDDNDLLDTGDNDLLYDGANIDDTAVIGDADADILASLTAPVQFNDFDNGAPAWRRRQSIAEAAAENLRFTKNGLFSETALADIEGIIGNGSSNGAFNFNEVLQ